MQADSSAAGTTGAVGTATIMMFEMTRDLEAVLPILATVGIAYAVRKTLSQSSIYTLKLLRRGHAAPEGLLSALAEAETASDAMSASFELAAIGDRPPDEPRVIVVHEGGEIRGTLRAPRSAAIDASQLDTRFVLVGGGDTLFEVLDSLHAAGATTALVVPHPSDRTPTAVVGVLDYECVARAIAPYAHLYCR